MAIGTSLPVGQRLYAIGGRQRGLRHLGAGVDWYEYQNGLVVELDAGTGQAIRHLEYTSPPDVCPDEDATILFKSGSLRDDKLYLCTQTEVIVYRVPSFEQIAYLSLPLFNDLHHVVPTDAGTVVIANTGLDMVMEASLDGDVIQTWNVLGDDPWGRFSPDVDYRKVKTTKPHLAHPNYVFLVHDEIWATRFELRDAICLTNPSKRIDIGLERVHDGFVHNDRVYFTTVDGHFVIADPERCVVEEVIDLTEMSPEGVQLGWCRSVHVDGDYAWIGFSRIRPTKFRENVGWAMRGFKRDFGTHLALYDLNRRERVAEIMLEPFGLNAIFSVCPRPIDVVSE